MNTPLPFRRELHRARLLSPGGEPLEQPVERRWDPLTGEAVRITAVRRHQPELEGDALPDLSALARATRPCVFCSERIERETPRFPPELAPEGRLRLGHSVLVPNLYPYGPHGGVAVLDPALHHAELHRLPRESWADALALCGDYLRRVERLDPAARWRAVTQNHLPGAGGSLLHPHLQVHADPFPSRWHGRLQEALDRWRARHGASAPAALVEAERDGPRWLGRQGPWAFFAAFAPRGFLELRALHLDCPGLPACSRAEWEALVDGLALGLGLYARRGYNSFNAGVLELRDGPRGALLASLLARARYAPHYRSDRSFHEVLLGEVATYGSPEELAAELRPAFGG